MLALRSQGAPIPAPALTAAGFSIAVQCWSFKEFTLFESIEMAAAAGTHVELYPGQKIGGGIGDLKFGPDLPDDELEAVIEHLAKNHVVAVNFGVTDIPKAEVEARKILCSCEETRPLWRHH